MSADYKQKYLQLRAKYLEAADVSFRLGYEQGMKDAMMQQMQQQMQMQQEAEAAAMQGAQEGELSPEEQAQMEAESGAPMEEAPPEAADQEGMSNSMGSELDQHIEELASLVAKGEKPSILSMREKVDELVSLRKSQKQKMSGKMKQNVSAQKSFVDNLLKKWETESKDTVSDLEEIIKQHEVNTEE